MLFTQKDENQKLTQGTSLSPICCWVLCH